MIWKPKRNHSDDRKGTSMFWPANTDYHEVIQHPQHCFEDPDLKAGTPETDENSLPRTRSGTFADVYKILGGNGHNWAVKCFTRQVPDLQERYHRIGETLC